MQFSVTIRFVKTPGASPRAFLKRWKLSRVYWLSLTDVIDYHDRTMAD